MTSQQTTSDTTPVDGRSASVTSHGVRGYLGAGVAVGLIAGAVLGALEPVARLWSVRELMTWRLWAEAVTFSVLTHQVLWAVWCGLVGLVAGLLRGSSPDKEGHPWAAGGAGLVAGLSVVVGMTAAAARGVGLATGLSGSVIALTGAVVLTAGAYFVLAWLGSGRLGRLAGQVAPIKLIVAVAVTAVCAVAQIAWRSRLDTGPALPLSTSTRPSSQPGGEAPHIVLIVCDTLRADRLGCYGYDRPTSPHMDALAEAAVVFTHAVSPGIWTEPAHASLFTGLNRSQHGVGWNRIWLDDRFMTLAEVLGDRGYQTIALSTNPNVSPGTNLTQGFETFLDPARLAYATRGLPYEFLKHVVLAGGPLGSWLGRWFVFEAGGHQTVLLTDEVLAGRSTDRPLLLFINLMETHQPYEPRRAYRRAFLEGDDLSRSFGIDQGLEATELYNLTDLEVFSDVDMAVLSRLYDARVRELDDVVAGLVRVLARRLDLDRTILVVTSDHGESIGEHDLLGHQWSVYDTLARVPLIVRWPERLEPKRVTTWVQTSDLYPTLLGWAGIEPRQVTKLLARPLDASIRGGPLATYRNVVTEYLSPPKWAFEIARRHAPHFNPGSWMVALQAIYDRGNKLILRSDGKSELYDLSADPGEERNLVGKRTRETQQLGRAFKRWRDSFEPFDPNAFTGPAGGRLNAEQRGRLRDLGYVQ